MQKFSKDIVTEVLSAIDIIEVIGPVVELKPAGPGRMKALCPFHQEKTPSFIVNQHRQTFHCFGCGKGGDAITFVQEHMGLTFVEALKALAEQAGVKLPASDRREQQTDSLRSHILEATRFAARHYMQMLTTPGKNEVGRAYLERRGITDETLNRFGVGLAPDDWSLLLEAARANDISAVVLENAGLIRRSETGRPYDFFRNRIIFPVRDVAGNIVAFGGRALDDSPAKYINSPENPVYRKSRVLYGLHEARDTLRNSTNALIVEGYFDLLRCFDVGIENVVATCGTALTLEQAGLLRRYVQEVVLVYDGDAAGVKAAMRGVGVLTEAGLRVRAIQLPGNQDPDDFVRNDGAKALLELVDQAPDFVQYYVAMSRDRSQTIEGRTEIAQELFDIIRHIDDAMRVDEYLKHIANALKINSWVCRQEFDKFIRKSQVHKAWLTQARQDTEAVATTQHTVSRDETLFLAMLMANKDHLERVQTLLAGIPLGNGPLEDVLRILLTDAPDNVLHSLECKDARRLFTAASTLDTTLETFPEDLLEKRVNRLMREALQMQSEVIKEAIEEAARNSDTSRYLALLAEKVEITRQIERVGAA